MEDFNEGVLVQCGLTKNESKVYISLLKLGSATAVEITKQSKVHRVNVYDVLDRLLAKGLISTVMRANKKIYEAANPEQLNRLIKEKEESLYKIMPQLKTEFKIKKEKQQVYHFFGPEGVMQAYYMMLEQDEKIIYGLGGSGLNRKYLKHRHAMFDKDRIKKGFIVKALYYEFTRKSNLFPEKKDERKYLSNRFKTTCMVDICGNLVINLLPIENNIMAIVIENKALADSYKQFFKFMWQFAKS